MTDTSETTRIEAFSDGVFAIAVTLLVLDLKLPHRGGVEVPLVRQLASIWPAYLAFLTSFFTIGVMWINHHRLFNLIGAADQILLVLNGLLLLGVSFLPFPTSVMAEYLLLSDQKSAAFFYGGTFFLIALVFNVLWRHATRGALLAPDTDRAEVEAITRQYAFGPPLYLVTTLLALVSAPLSIAANLGLAIFFSLPPKMAVGGQIGRRN